MHFSLFSSITVLSLLGQKAIANPIVSKSTSAANTCTLPWIKLGELALNLLPSSEGPKLCSSVLHKYATTTQTTTITAPTVTKVATVSSTSTAPTLTTSVTTTVSIESDVSTSTTTLTTVTTSTTVSTEDFTTITASVNEKRAATTTDCTSRLASLLNIASTLVNEFCSCESPGSTSTTTVIVSSTVTPTTTIPSTIIATTLTPKPSTIFATVSTTFTSVVSTVVIQSTITTTIASTTTTSSATVTNPGCASTVTGVNPVNTVIYSQYVFTDGFKENTNNPGNDATANYPPQTTTFPAGDFCTALQGCASFTAPQNGQYDSFDFHFLISENVYECTAYFDPNGNAAYFNVQDSDVGQAYGYTFNGYA